MGQESTTPGAEFLPEMLSRRGELVSWGLALLTLIAWLILWINARPVFLGLKALAILLALTGLLISLGNWMDRQTRLRIDLEGVAFENGLRKVFLRWEEIQRVEVFPSAWGSKVRVLAEEAHFDFRMLGEVTMQGEVKGRMGFADGEQILRHICKQANLKQTQGPGNSSYYLRE